MMSYFGTQLSMEPNVPSASIADPQSAANMTEGQPLNMFVCLIWSVPPDLLHASLNSPPCVVTPVSLAHSPYAQHTLFKLSGPADPPLTPPLVDYY